MTGLADLIARWPRLSSSLVATLIGLLSLAAFAGLLTRQRLVQLQVQQDAAAFRAKAIMDDSTTLLQSLNQRHHNPDCEEQSLTTYRAAVFATASQVEVGVLGEDGELLCTTLVGRLARPVAASGTDLDLVTDTGQIYLVAYNMSLVAGDGHFKSTIVRQGRFHTVINPKAMDSLFTMGQDVTRVVLPEGGSFPIHINPNLSGKWRRLLSGEWWVDTAAYQFDWQERAFLSAQSVPKTHFVIQSVLPLDEFLQHHRTHLMWAALVSVFVSLLTYGAATPLLRKLGNLEYRILKLLRSENLICMYQPMVDLGSGKLIGCDVLMRLRDADTIVYPEQALPAIVKRNLTWELDQLVVRTALRELGQGLPDTCEINVAFNLFPDNISCKRLCALFESETHCAIWSHRFNFELAVTEKVCQSAMLEELICLKRAGFLVSVDGFGSGYSNLGSIKNLSPNFLKIDKSFVHDMEDASLRSSLIPEIVGIAQAVGAALIAEGIENDVQRQMLHGHGVEFGQGYLFARPMPINEFLAYFNGAKVLDGNELTSARLGQ